MIVYSIKKKTYKFQTLDWSVCNRILRFLCMLAQCFSLSLSHTHTHTHTHSRRWGLLTSTLFKVMSMEQNTFKNCKLCPWKVSLPGIKKLNSFRVFLFQTKAYKKYSISITADIFSSPCNLELLCSTTLMKTVVKVITNISVSQMS